jgi:hypothetical protein
MNPMRSPLAVLGRLILSKGDKSRMPQMQIASPLDKLELSDESRLQPLVFFHLSPSIPLPNDRFFFQLD